MSIRIESPTNFEQVPPGKVVATGKATNNQYLVGELVNLLQVKGFSSQELQPLPNGLWALFFDNVSSGPSLLSVLDPSGARVSFARPVYFMVGAASGKKLLAAPALKIMTPSAGAELSARNFAAAGTLGADPIDTIANGGAVVLYEDPPGTPQSIPADSLNNNTARKTWSASFTIPNNAPCPGSYSVKVTDTAGRTGRVDGLHLADALCSGIIKKRKRRRGK